MLENAPNTPCEITRFSSDFAKSVGAVLHVFRVKLNLTQELLAKQINKQHDLDVRQSTVSKIEKRWWVINGHACSLL